jgi:maleate cis-trans isomerase
MNTEHLDCLLVPCTRIHSVAIANKIEGWLSQICVATSRQASVTFFMLEPKS